MTPLAPDPRTSRNGAQGLRRVVITGIGPITGSGTGVEAFRTGLRSGCSPARQLTRFDPSPFRTHIGVEVTDFDPEEFMDRTSARRLDRYGHFSIASGRLALDDAGLDPSSVDPDRAAIQMGSALGGIARAEEELVQYIQKGVRGVDPRLALMVFGGASSCNLAIEFGFSGPNSTNGMSCASGTIAVGEAFRLIRDGTADVALAGGIEAPLAPLSFGAFAIIRAMSTRNDHPGKACRPFDSERDGFVMGEGACTLVMESEEHALARGARIYASVDGYAVTNDAHHMTAPRPDGAQAARAMREAMQVAGITPEEVDYVNAHASSTPLNDSTESGAIHSVLGDRALEIPVNGTKPFYGHALGASGAIEVGITCLAFQDGWIPPTLNLQEPGEGCVLDYVPGQGREVSLRRALSNSFGFGGINASLILSAPGVPVGGALG
jgi:3-oxoacyl-[acyl-carrier-protein] synthase II